MIPTSSLRRAMLAAAVLHAVAAGLAAWLVVPAHQVATAVVDIEIAPAVPLPEALPAEVAKPPLRDVDHADRADQTPPEPDSTAPNPPGEAAIDAGIDAPADARPDAAIDARPDAAPDAAIDARLDAAPDAGVPDAMIVARGEIDADRGDAGAEIADAGDGAAQVALADAGDAAAQVALADAGNSAAQVALVDAGDGAAQVALVDAGDGADRDAGPRPAPAAGLMPSAALVAAASAGPATASGPREGSNAGSGAAVDTAALAAALAAAAPAVPGVGDEPAVDGAPTTAGTAANLLAYFPDGHVITALIRLDRLRGTEWAAETERLLRPMPDYQLLFGARDADIAGKLETLVISTPQPRDAAATTLVARTQLSRAALRDALGAGSQVTWSVARGGLLGRRTSKRFPSDQRVFLSPFPGWFLLAQPGDLGGLTAAARGKLDTAVATGALPPWLAGIRSIESESGDKRGPALVVTVALGGKRYDLPGYGFGLGVRSIPTPDRASLAVELVAQGWLARGNLRFASDADAAEFVASVQQLQQRLAGPALQAVLGKRIARVVAALAFARNGPRVSYATSASIADARGILAAVAQQIDQYFRAARPPGP